VADTLNLVVPTELSGSRVDKALAVLLKISRNEARLLFEGGVLVDGSVVRPRDQVEEGSIIETPRPIGQPILKPEPVEFGVVIESSAYLVVDKPAGVVVHPGSGRTFGTLAAGLLYRYPDLEGVGMPSRWGLVHRLDRDTSGVLLIARTQGAYESLTADLKARRISRVYLALVNGIFPIPTGTIEAPIGRDPARPTRRAVVESGKRAATHYEVMKSYEDHDATLLKVRLETGRTHQIRVHLSAIDHPIIGDRTYGKGPTSVGSPRTFLHASEIDFVDPGSGESVSATAPLPQDLEAVLDNLDPEDRPSGPGHLPLTR
jgi:23S rRNA pseudouridine1911/1915/1917 synthase